MVEGGKYVLPAADPPAKTYQAIKDHINVLFKADMHKECESLIQQLMASAKDGSLERADGTKVPATDDDLKAFLAGDLCQMEIEHKKLYFDFLSLVGDVESWEEYQSGDTVKNDMKIFYKKGDGGRLMTYMDLMIDSSFINCMALWWEVDLMPTWSKEMKNPEFYANPSELSGGWRCKMAFPWPMSDRYMQVSLVSFVDRKTRGILNIMKDVPLDQKTWFGKEVPEFGKKKHRMNVIRGYDYIEKVSETETRYIGIAEMDMNLSKITNDILNYLMKSMLYKQGVAFREQAKKVPGSEYEKRIKDTRKDFYRKIEALVD